MKCKLNIRAATGQNSVLFKDIAEDVQSMTTAVDMYYYTRTPEFRRNYKGGFDSNGEPIYKDIIKDGYDDIKNYHNTALEANATAYKELVQAVPRIISLLERRIKSLDSKSRGKDIQYLRDIVKVLENEEVTSSIPRFLELAVTSTNKLKTLAHEAVKEENKDLLKSCRFLAESGRFSEEDAPLIIIKELWKKLKKKTNVLRIVN